MAGLSELINRYRVSGDPLFTDRRVELVAVLLTGILIVVLLLGIGRLVLPSRPSAILPASDTLMVSELPSAGVVSGQLSSQVRARPVFWPSRRPVLDEEAQQEQPVEPDNASTSALDRMELRGIFGGGDTAGIIALVKGKKKRVMLGDKVVGWKLESIDGDSATFVANGRSQTVPLVRADLVDKK